MSEIQMSIWGRDFNLDVYFKKYQGEEITEIQKKSYDYFINADVAVEQTLKELILFVEKYYKDELKEKNIVNIFKYVIPKTLYIPNDSENRKVVLLCDFRFEIEHGLALVYENETLSNIVLQDDVL